LRLNLSSVEIQVAGDKAAAILGVGGGVSSAKAGADTIGIVKVGAEVGMTAAGEIGRTGSIIRVFRGFKVKLRSFSKF
jgi:hypothetical protein